MLIMWGALVFAGYLGAFLSPRQAGYVWVAAERRGGRRIVCDQRLRIMRETGIRTFDFRMLIAFAAVLRLRLPLHERGSAISRRARWARSGRSISCCSTSSPDCGSGYAFVAIGLSIIALTLAGYFLAGDWFDLWMAFVNGGGLMLGGLWMRRS